MKKMLFLLIACSSLSLMGVNDIRDSTQCDPSEYDCCWEILPYAHKDPFYQPHLSALKIQNTAVYQPQMDSEESAHAPRPPYNPAVRLFLTIRAALSSTIIPAPPTQTPPANHREQTQPAHVSSPSTILERTLHCMSSALCGCRSAE